MSPATERRPHGTPGSGLAAATAAGIIAQQVAGKAVRDALFLSSFHVKSLPLMMAAGAALSLAAVFGTSRLMATYAPRRVLVALFTLSTATLSLEWMVIAYMPRAMAVGVYLHFAVFNPIVLSAFWSLVNEHFDPRAARSAVARIGIGGTIGGVLGGLAAWRASMLVSVPTTILLLAGVNLLCLAGTLAIRPRDPSSMPIPTSEPARGDAWSLSSLVNAPYLRNLALLVAVGSAMSSMLDYVFSVQVTAAYGSGAALLAYFSLFGLAVSVASFLLQVSLGQVAMEKVGLAVNIAVLPAIVILGGAVGLAVPGLASVSLLRGAEAVQRNTLFRSAYELLYTPLQEQQKRAAKALIDIGFDRLGTVLGSGFAIGIVALFSHNQAILLGAVLLLAFATLPVARRLHVGYVAALKGRLEEADRALADAGPPSSRLTLGLDDKAGDALIEQVERVREHEDEDEAGLVAQSLARGPELMKLASDLLSQDVDRARAALSGWDKAKLPLVPFAAMQLAREDLQADARRALRLVAHDATGQLLDWLLDPNIEFAVRRRIPAVLAVCSSQRAADGLLLGLADPRFEVRYACVRALVRVADRGNIAFSRDEIIETINREIERATTAFSELDDGSDDDEGSDLDLIARDRVTRSVENLFSLLSLLLDRDALRLCLRALHQDNDHQRGTALEYLQTVLPSELRDKLLPLLSEAGPIPSPREPAQLLVELTRLPISRLFGVDKPLPEQLQGCCQALVSMGATFARIWLYNESERVLELRASAGLYTHLDGPHARVPLGSLKIGRIGATRKPHITNQVVGDPEVPEQEWAKQESLASFAGYPLVVGDKLLGVIALFSKRKLSSQMLGALSAIADQVAEGIDRRGLAA